MTGITCQRPHAPMVCWHEVSSAEVCSRKHNVLSVVIPVYVDCTHMYKADRHYCFTVLRPPLQASPCCGHRVSCKAVSAQRLLNDGVVSSAGCIQGCDLDIHFLLVSSPRGAMTANLLYVHTGIIHRLKCPSFRTYHQIWMLCFYLSNVCVSVLTQSSCWLVDVCCA